jgi:O-antigen ligase
MAVAITVIAVIAVFFAGPRHVSTGMLAGAVAIGLYGLVGLAGPLSRAAPDLAVLFASGALWTVGYIAARRRSALEAAWATLLWGAVAYCAWMFAVDVSASMSSNSASGIEDAFTTPATASVLFGLFAVIGLSRVLHVIKQMDAEALPHSAMFDRVVRDGLSGILLLVFSITCLTIANSRPGMIMTTAVLVALAWWDTLSISTREHRGILLRLGALVAPVIALGLAAWGVGLAWISDETIAPGIGLSDTLPNVQRITAYMGAWMEQPAIGHGLGSIDAVGNRTTTLLNAKAMLAPGDTHNVLVSWLVETGIIGLALLVLALGAMHARIFAALTSRKTPRTFLRLGVMAGVLMFLHGVSDSSLDLPSATWLYALLLGAACGVATGRRIRQSKSTAG